jgi:hypothetical protein
MDDDEVVDIREEYNSDEEIDRHAKNMHDERNELFEEKDTKEENEEEEDEEMKILDRLIQLEQDQEESDDEEEKLPNRRSITKGEMKRGVKPTIASPADIYEVRKLRF